MEIQKLVGKKISLDGSDILVNKIEFEPDSVLGKVYRLNGDRIISKSDISTALTLLELEEEEEKEKNLSIFQKIKRKFGLFFQKSRKNVNEFGLLFGIRFFGYHKCAVFLKFRFFKLQLHAEFCFRDKDEYVEGKMPDPFTDFKQIF